MVIKYAQCHLTVMSMSVSALTESQVSLWDKFRSLTEDPWLWVPLQVTSYSLFLVLLTTGLLYAGPYFTLTFKAKLTISMVWEDFFAPFCTHPPTLLPVHPSFRRVKPVVDGCIKLWSSTIEALGDLIQGKHVTVNQQSHKDGTTISSLSINHDLHT